MKAKEKAVEIHTNIDYEVQNYWTAKNVSIILVEKMIEEYQSMSDLYTYLSFPEREDENSVVLRLVYWMEVKQELEKL